jgi:Ca-activated chloride channel family protein
MLAFCTRVMSVRRCLYLWLVAAASAVPAAQGQHPVAQAPAWHVSVDLVPVYVSVLDSKGQPVRGLPVQAFEVLEQGRPQRIQLFDPAERLALDLVLLLDRSLSTTGEWEFEGRAAERFLERVLRPGDEAAVFAFAEGVTELSGFSGDLRHLRAAVRRARTGSGTSLFDAIYLGAQALGAREPGHRRVMVAVTDAGETTSRVSFEQARDATAKAGALLYTVLVRPVKSESGRNTAGEHALEAIAEVSGGMLYPVDTAAQFDPTFDRIQAELHTQYLLAYAPDHRPPPGSYQPIQVRLAPGYGGPGWTVRARAGYFAPSEAAHP